MAIDLNSLHRGPRHDPPRILVYGEHGLGKSTFGAHAPKPVFIPTEDGISALDVTSFPLAKSYGDVIEAIGSLYSGDHDFETVVLDSVDWLEQLVWSQVAEEHGKASVSDLDYGRGYAFAVDKFREVLAGLNALRTERGMAVILTGHCEVRRYDDPTSEPYDRYHLKLHKRAAAIVQEWCDVIGFASQAMVVKSEDTGFNKKVKRAIQTGGHVLHLQRTPAYDAKNRYGLPATIALDWSAFSGALDEALSTPTE